MVNVRSEFWLLWKWLSPLFSFCILGPQGLFGGLLILVWIQIPDPDPGHFFLFLKNFKKDLKRMMCSKNALVGTIWCHWAPLDVLGWALTYPGFDLPGFWPTQVLIYLGFDLPGFWPTWVLTYPGFLSNILQISKIFLSDTQGYNTKHIKR